MFFYFYVTMCLVSAICGLFFDRYFSFFFVFFLIFFFFLKISEGRFLPPKKKRRLCAKYARALPIL